MLRPLRVLACRPDSVGVLVALALKGAGSVLTFAMLAIAARAMGPEEFGTFTIWFSALLFLAVTTVFGQETVVMRDWGRHAGTGDYDRARSALRRSVLVALALPLAAVPAVAAAATATRHDGWFLACAAAFVVVASYLIVSAHAARTLVDIRQSDLHGEITWRIVVIAALGTALALHMPVTATALLGWAALGMAVSLAFHIVAIRRVLAALP
ncbi:MAG TPA: hypothetical protein VF641_04460, partial [Methylobacterium sp.]